MHRGNSGYPARHDNANNCNRGIDNGLHPKKMSYELLIKKDTEEEIKEFLDGYKWHLVIQELDEHLRKIVKYNDSNIPEDKIEAYEYVRELIYKIVESKNLQVYE